jgi:hypothetical protein
MGRLYPAEPPELCDAEGARKLKERIEAYWAEKGFSVAVTLPREVYVPQMRTSRHDVRSDMVDGYPKEWGKR